MTDRTAALRWAQSVAADPTSCFLDTETSGLGVDAEIVDIAILSINGIVLLDQLVKPLRPIPPDATQVHGISNEMVEGADPWQNVWWKVAALAEMQRVIVFNVGFDGPLIDRLIVERCGQPISAGWECAMLQYAAFRGERSRKGPGYRWWSLAAAAAWFGIEPGIHRALADCQTTRNLVLKMAELAPPPVASQMAMPALGGSA